MADDLSLPQRADMPRKLVLGLLAMGIAWMWWNALSKNKAPSARTAQAAASARNTNLAEPQAIITLPTNIQREALENAQRDPFAILVPPPPKAVAIKKPAPPAMPVPVPPPFAVAAPSPPPLNLRFMGQATSPDGERMVYAQLGQETVLLAKGMQLSNGYQVVSIEAKWVNLLFAPLNYSAQLVLPDPPKYEIR